MLAIQHCNITLSFQKKLMGIVLSSKECNYDTVCAGKNKHGGVVVVIFHCN